MRKAFAIFLLLISLVLLYILRINAMLVLTVFIFAYLFIRFSYKFRRIAAGLVFVAFTFPPVHKAIFGLLKSKLTLMLYYHISLSYLGGYIFRLLPERYYRYEDVMRPWYTPDVRTFDFVTSYCKGFITFLLQPSPFSIRKITHLAAVPEMLIWYIIVFFALYGIYRSLRQPSGRRLGLIVLLLLFTSAIGLSEANMETLMRHRGMILPIYIIFAAYGMRETRRLLKR
jgi:hypothetical protein